MDTLLTIMLCTIMSQGFYLIWRVTKVEKRMVKLETSFNNHLRYLHKVEVEA